MDESSFFFWELFNFEVVMDVQEKIHILSLDQDMYIYLFLNVSVSNSGAVCT